MTSIAVNQRVRLEGYYRLVIRHEDGGEDDTGWFPNLITNQGLDWIGAGGPTYNTSNNWKYLNTHCGVGTGSAAPSFTDTQLTSFLAMYPAVTSSNVQASTTTYIAGPPPYWSVVFGYGFATGAVVGNISEVGVGNTAQTDTQPQLFSHALILDGSGNPTTLSILVTDALTVYYELRYYIDVTDNTYTMSISGTSYSGTYRRLNITAGPPLYLSLSPDNMIPTGTVYQGFTLGATTASAPGNTALANTTTTAFTPYTTGTYYREVTSTFSTSVGNFASSISGMSVVTNHGAYQFSISPVIPKTSSYTLTITWHISWARYP